MLDRNGVTRIEPVFVEVKERVAGALYSPTDQSGDVRMSSRNLAAYASKHLGVTFAFGTNIQHIELSSGKAIRVLTDNGALSADHYVMALGCDGPAMGRSIGLELPIYPVKGNSITLPLKNRRAAPAIGGADEHNLAAYCATGDRLRLASTAELSGFDRSHRPEKFRSMFRSARELLPSAADYERPEFRAGLRPMLASITMRSWRSSLLSRRAARNVA